MCSFIYFLLIIITPHQDISEIPERKMTDQINEVYQEDLFFINFKSSFQSNSDDVIILKIPSYPSLSFCVAFPLILNPSTC